MIYLDNSATSHFKPISVKIAQLSALNKYSFNPNRGGYKHAIDLSMKILDCRETICNFFNATDSSNVIFTSGCTMAENMAIYGTLQKGGHVITTMYEHNSVLRTLEKYKKEGIIDYTVVHSTGFSPITAQDIAKAIRPNTYLVICNHTSNVTGTTMDISKIGSLCHKKKLLFMVDGAQSAGHINIDMQSSHINMLCLAGHKGLFGPTGIGALLLNNVSLKPLITGGTGTYSVSLDQPNDTPEGFESGTVNVPGILGFYAGIKYTIKHFDNINYKTYKLTKYLLENLKTMNNVTVYSDNPHSGVVSFNINNYSSTDVCNILAEKYGIYARCGLHCAPLIHKHLGTTECGTVRISINHKNSLPHIKILLTAICNISAN